MLYPSYRGVAGQKFMGGAKFQHGKTILKVNSGEYTEYVSDDKYISLLVKNFKYFY